MESRPLGGQGAGDHPLARGWRAAYPLGGWPRSRAAGTRLSGTGRVRVFSMAFGWYLWEQAPQILRWVFLVPDLRPQPTLPTSCPRGDL